MISSSIVSPVTVRHPPRATICYVNFRAQEKNAGTLTLTPSCLALAYLGVIVKPIKITRR